MDRTCPVCGREYHVPISRWKDGKGRFCSRSCYHASGGGSAALSFEDRFWSHVNKDGPIMRPELGPCWEWTGSKTRDGYGRFRFKGKLVQATHASWQINVKPVPDSTHMCHHCDWPPCVHWAHVYPGNAQTNAMDRYSRGRPSDHLPRNAKLTDDQVREIRSKSTGRRGEQTALAREYGISQPSVSDLLRGVAWKHVV